MLSNVKITLRLDKALLVRVDLAARRLGYSRTELINQALITQLENVEDLEIANQRGADQKDANVSLEAAKKQLQERKF